MDHEMEVARLRDLVNETIDNLRHGAWPKDEILCSLETGLHEIDQEKAVAKAEREKPPASMLCECGCVASTHIVRRHQCTRCSCPAFYPAGMEVARG